MVRGEAKCDAPVPVLWRAGTSDCLRDLSRGNKCLVCMIKLSSHFLIWYIIHNKVGIIVLLIIACLLEFFQAT